MPGDAEITIATMRDAARAMSSVTTSTGDELRVIETAIRALQAAKCDRLAEMDETKSHETEGASSISTWARRELNQDAGLTRQMVRAASTFRDLPSVGDAAKSGEISFEHVTSFAYALKHIGVDETRMIENHCSTWRSRWRRPSSTPRSVRSATRSIRTTWTRRG